MILDKEKYISINRVFVDSKLQRRNKMIFHMNPENSITVSLLVYIPDDALRKIDIDEIEEAINKDLNKIKEYESKLSLDENQKILKRYEELSLIVEEEKHLGGRWNYFIGDFGTLRHICGEEYCKKNYIRYDHWPTKEKVQKLYECIDNLKLGELTLEECVSIKKRQMRMKNDYNDFFEYVEIKDWANELEKYAQEVKEMKRAIEELKKVSNYDARKKNNTNKR